MDNYSNYERVVPTDRTVSACAGMIKFIIRVPFMDNYSNYERVVPGRYLGDISA